MRRVILAVLLVLATAGPVQGWEQYEATAYDYTGSMTYTETWPEVGRTVAVDPGAIPLQSVVIISGRGWYRAEDTGGAVQGRVVDIYMANRGTCLRWGRRDVWVFHFLPAQWVNIRPTQDIKYAELMP